MKLTVFLLTAGFLNVSASGLSQNVSFSGKDVPLQTVLSEVKKQTGFVFLFSRGVLKDAKPVTVEASNLPLSAFLDLVFKDQPLKYSIDSKSIFISAKPSERQRRSPSILDDAVPPILLRGKVTDENGQPLAGASVTVKKSKNSGVTDGEGVFSVNVNEGDVLVVSYVQYQTKEVPVTASVVSGGNALVVSLSRSESKLDEVQIIAYGTTSRRLSTGNISTVKAADIAKSPVGNPLLAIQGRAPGVFIEQATGLPGSGVKVRVQGQNSISKGSDPLYVIDGVPYVSQLLPSLNGIVGSSNGGFNVVGNPLSLINLSDIESIDVLKDADATAIYGSRAANGAILITTKKAKAGKTRVDVNVQNGWGKVTRKMDLLNTQEYIEMRKEVLKNDSINLNVAPYNSETNKVIRFYDLLIWDTTKFTDWQKELIGGTANYLDATASISGGNAITSFLLGATYRKETTVFPGDLNDQKTSVHFNITNTSQNNKFRMMFSGNYLYDFNQLQQTDLTSDALRMAPNAPALYNDDGTLNWRIYQMSNGSLTTIGTSNPLVFNQNKYKVKTKNLVTNATFSYELLPGLNAKSSFGYTSMLVDEITTNPIVSFAPIFRQMDWAKGSSSFGHNDISSWTIEPQLAYQKSISHGSLDALLGATFYELNSSREAFNASGYASDLQLEDIKAAPILMVEPNAGSIISKYRYNAVFGRINYNWKDKYITSFNFRRDGSSRFGENSKFHNFGSVAGAWIFSNEDWLQRNLKILSFGKLRVSYGTTGNDQIGDYAYLSLYDEIARERPYQNTNGLLPQGLPNPYLEWEETRKLQFGLDLGFFKDRLFLSANYYINRSSNQLLGYSLPAITGNGNITINFPALVENTGWELSLASTNITTKKFTWSSSVNLTVPRNELADFPGLATSVFADRLIIGESINIQRQFKFAGVDPTTGIYQFLDREGKLTSAPGSGNENKIVVYNPDPKFYGGFLNSFSFKGLQLDILFQFASQKGPNYFLGNNPGTVGRNQPAHVESRWQKPGDITEIQRYNSYVINSLSAYSFIARQSDRAFSDASYLRLKNIHLSWQFPPSWRQSMKLENFRIYVSGQNLLTITNYPGLDPETKSIGSLPPLRMITFGLQLGL